MEKSIITSKYIEEKVCKYYNVSEEDLEYGNREGLKPVLRQIVVYLARKLTSEHDKIICKTIRRNREYCVFAANKIVDLMSIDKKFIEEINNVEKYVKGEITNECENFFVIRKHAI